VIAHAPAAMIEKAPQINPASIQAQLYARLAEGLEETRLPFAEFARQSWPIVEPARPYMTSWHLEAIYEHLEAVELGQITRLIINGPPRLGKSIPVTEQFPAWKWTRRPSERIIGASYADPLATKLAVDSRNIIMSDWYQANWGRRFQLTGDQNVKHEYAWHALRSTLTKTQGPVRLIGNVKGRKNWFYKLCRKAEAGEPGHHYARIRAADAVTAGILKAEEVEDARRTLPELVFKELFDAEPSDDTGNPFGIAAIRAAIRPMGAAPAAVNGVDSRQERSGARCRNSTSRSSPGT
jgi:hypothetical protein